MLHCSLDSSIEVCAAASQILCSGIEVCAAASQILCSDIEVSAAASPILCSSIEVSAAASQLSFPGSAKVHMLHYLALHYHTILQY